MNDMNLSLVHAVIVEDNVQMQTIISNLLLQQIGIHKVAVKESAHEFIEYMSFLENPKNVQLIILDMKLEDSLTGLDILKWLKRRNSTKAIPVIVVTGSTDGSEMEEAKELGAIAYLRKPIDMKLLKHIIYEIPQFKTIVYSVVT